MKTRLITLAGLGTAFLSANLNAEIVLTEDLSLTGYLDMYGLSVEGDDDDFISDVAEFEVAFNYTTEPVFSTVELSYDGDSDVSFETAIVGWNATENLVLSAGNILSYLGWETYDATGLYQFSYAYRDFSPLYPAYAVGAAADYGTDDFSFGIWIGDGTDNEVSVEVAGKFTGIEGLTVFLGYADDPAYEMINPWVSYEAAGFVFAFEYIDVDNDMGPDSQGYLAMVNYAWESAALTLRYSIEETDGMEDWELFTISPSYTFTDNLLGLVELSLVEGGADYDYQAAVELIFSF